MLYMIQPLTASLPCPRGQVSRWLHHGHYSNEGAGPGNSLVTDIALAMKPSSEDVY